MERNAQNEVQILYYFVTGTEIEEIRRFHDVTRQTVIRWIRNGARRVLRPYTMRGPDGETLEAEGDEIGPESDYLSPVLATIRDHKQEFRELADGVNLTNDYSYEHVIDTVHPNAGRYGMHPIRRREKYGWKVVDTTDLGTEILHGTRRRKLMVVMRRESESSPDLPWCPDELRRHFLPEW